MLEDHYRTLGITHIEGHTQQCAEKTEFLKRAVIYNNVKTVLEIGFGGGHSSETFLLANPDVHVTSFDNNVHNYVQLGKHYIDETFPGRHKLFFGDSTEKVPAYTSLYGDTKKFDLIFIDGSFAYDVCHKDVYNCKHLAHANTIVILDDVMQRQDWVKIWNVGPSRVWNECKENGVIQELGSIDFNHMQSLAYGKYIHNQCQFVVHDECQFFVQSLMLPDRLPIVKMNQAKFKDLQVFQSINGYNEEETLAEMKNLDVEFHQLDRFHRTYGTLACWLSKFKILEYQVQNNIPYLCFIEDDLLLQNNFMNFVIDKLGLFVKDKDLNIIRLCNWGEGYVTSLEGAKRVVECLRRDGIIKNIDNQLRENCGKEIHVKDTPFNLVIPTNSGDCLKTRDLDFDIV